MTASYREYRPSAALAPYVECYWSRSSCRHMGAQSSHTVLPDGCMDIVFNFGEAWSGSNKGSVARRAGFQGGAVVGTMTAPLLVAPGVREDFFGVRFRPGMARAFLPAPAFSFTDRAIALADVWGREGARLEQQVEETGGERGRVGRMEWELRRRLDSARSLQPCVAAALHLITVRSGAVTMREASQFAGVSRQQLARSFAENVGVPPKMFARVIRFRGLLERLREARAVCWSEAAAHAGYYDQSHLIADFKEFAGTTPERYLAPRPA